MYEDTLYWHFVSEDMKTNEDKNLYCFMHYYLPNRIIERELCVVCGTSSEEGECGGKPEGKRPLGIPRCRWENNIKIYLKEI
jgi:hypothetical protein